MWNLHATEDEFATLDQRVDVVTNTNVNHGKSVR
jgi:hypothetical protein